MDKQLKSLATLALAAVCGSSFGQLNITERLSQQHYSYVYGGGPDVHSGNALNEKMDLLLGDSLVSSYSGSTSGEWVGLSYNGSVSINLLHLYVLDGDTVDDVMTIHSQATSSLSASSGGDIGGAVANGTNPGNLLTLHFTPLDESRLYRLRGNITIGHAEAYISLQFFDGIVWQNQYTSWELPGLIGAFDKNHMLYSNRNYRLNSGIAHSVNGNGSVQHSYEYDFEPVPRIRGRVVLQDFDGPVQNETVEVEVRDGFGAVVQTVADVPLDADGDYTFYSGLDGVHAVAVKGRTWISQAVGGVDIDMDGIDNVNFSLPNGDCDGDNEVAIGDYSILSGAFGTSEGGWGFVRAADLNGDTGVDIGDYAILSANFGLMGE